MKQPYLEMQNSLKLRDSFILINQEKKKMKIFQIWRRDFPQDVENQFKQPYLLEIINL